MDEKLQELIGQLQDQKCPPAVLEGVMRRIEREKAPRPVRSYLVWAFAMSCVVGAVVFWQWHEHRQARARALVVQQTQEAFGYIGQALIRAAAHTENALSKEAVPPLRNGFETVKNKVTKPI